MGQEFVKWRCRRQRMTASSALAAERAPRWGGLHLNWSKALWASGEKGDAQWKLAAAARMDLSASEKLELLRYQMLEK